jgi:hypothetical protein
MLGLASAVQPAFSQIGPKNFMSPTYRSPVVQAAVPQGLTKKEASLTESQRTELLGALNSQETIRITEEDRSRWNLRDRILRKLDAPKRPAATASAS